MNIELLALPLITGYVIVIFIVFILGIRRKTKGRLFMPVKFFLALVLAMILLTFILC